MTRHTSSSETSLRNILLTFLRRLPWIVVFIALVATAVLLTGLRSCEEPVAEVITTNPEGHIGLSPEQIRHIEEIGQWVFLTIQTEEMVDTVRRRLFVSDDALSRIYEGTLHFGVDMNELSGTEWITCSHDTVHVNLPRVRLLDKRFINEAHTRTFYQEGDWDAQALKLLYEKARRRMLARCHTTANLERAKRNARTEVEAFFKSFGFNQVEITFKK